MRYIKTYEIKRQKQKRKGYNTFYYVPYNDEETINLLFNIKLNIDNNVKREIFDDLKRYLFNDIKRYSAGFYIGILPKYMETNYQYWICTPDYNNKQNGYDEFINDKYIFGGDMKFEDYELNAMNYNL